MKALLIDRLPVDHQDKEDHFILQEGHEPSLFKGPVKILTEKVSALPNAVIDSDGTVRKSSLDFDARFSSLLEAAVEKKFQDISMNRKLSHLIHPGEVRGLRLENLIGLPEASGHNIGRLIYNTSDEKVYLDAGWGFKKISSDRFAQELRWQEGELSKTIELSNEDIEDARLAIWQLCDSGNDFERIECSIKTPDKKTVIVSVKKSLPAGNYRLLGIE